MFRPALKNLLKKLSLRLTFGRVVVMRRKKNVGLIELLGNLIDRGATRANKRMNRKDPAKSEALINIKQHS